MSDKKVCPKAICVIVYVIEMLLYASCLCILYRSDAFFITYLVMVLVFCVGTTFNHLKKKEFSVIAALFAILLSIAIVLPNHLLWQNRIVILPVLTLGGWIGFYNVFRFLDTYASRLTWKRANTKKVPVFLITYVTLSVCYLTVFFLAYYPGNLSTDSFNQLNQITSGIYNDHHPIFHTLLIKVFFDLGLEISGDINAAVAFYSVFQILFMSFVFAFALHTLYKSGLKKMYLLVIGLLYLLLPYHILYSFTMWKDVSFSGVVLLFVLFCFRYTQNIGNKKLNLIFTGLSGIGVCLLRSNGVFAFGLLLLAGCIIMGKKNRSLIITLFIALLVCLGMKLTVLRLLNVTGTEKTEMLAVPLQQVANVIKETDDLTERERELCEQLLDVDRIKDVYNPEIVDPIKRLIREKHNQEVFTERSGEFVSLYLNTLLRHPGICLITWVDLTKGYWSGGYSYWIWSRKIDDNDLGVNRTVKNAFVDKAVDTYLRYYSKFPLSKLFNSIGLMVWANLIAVYIAITRKDVKGLFCALPPVMVIVTLLIATPVYAEFRYAYSVFCSLPVIMAIVTRPNIHTDMDNKMVRGEE